MNKLILVMCSLYSLTSFADSSSMTSVSTWKAVAIKDSTRSQKTVEISSLGAAYLISNSGASSQFSTGDQKIYALPQKQDIAEYKLLAKVISNTISNEDKTSELEVNVYYGSKPMTKNQYQQILVSDKKDDFSFKVTNADNKAGHFNGNVGVEFLFVWDGSQSI